MFLADALEFVGLLVVHELARFLVALRELLLTLDLSFELRALADRAVAVARPGDLLPSYFSASIVTATAPFADSRTLLPSTSATRPPSMKWWWPL
jgi:hypothetical protein